MQNEPVNQQNTAESKKFKLSKKHFLIGISAIAIATAIVMAIPSKSAKPSKLTTASAAAVNQAENTNPVSNTNTDGYAITGANPVSSGNTSTLPIANQGSTAGASPSLPAALGNGENSDELNSISTELQSIQDSLNTDSATGNIKQIKSEINSVLYQVKSLITTSDNNIADEIQSASQTLASQLAGMQGQLSNIQQLNQPGSYIDSSNLPFTVQFIDNVSGQSVVTVNYNNLLTPVSVGESLAGWTLISADYASQYAVFQNSKDQLVKAGNNVALQGE